MTITPLGGEAVAPWVPKESPHTRWPDPYAAKQRTGSVLSTFADVGSNKALSWLNLRGKDKVNKQWHLYCLAHDIRKPARSGGQG